MKQLTDIDKEQILVDLRALLRNASSAVIYCMIFRNGATGDESSGATKYAFESIFMNGGATSHVSALFFTQARAGMRRFRKAAASEDFTESCVEDECAGQETPDTWFDPETSSPSEVDAEELIPYLRACLKDAVCALMFSLGFRDNGHNDDEAQDRHDEALPYSEEEVSIEKFDIIDADDDFDEADDSPADIETLGIKVGDVPNVAYTLFISQLEEEILELINAKKDTASQFNEIKKMSIMWK